MEVVDVALPNDIACITSLMVLLAIVGALGAMVIHDRFGAHKNTLRVES